jgi:cell division protease FtsH
MAISSGGVLDDDIVSEAFEKVTMGEARSSRDSLRTARHEAGHAIVMWVLGSAPVYVTIVGRGDFGGYAALDDEGARGVLTRQEMEDSICKLFGGRAAEFLCYGGAAGVSSGAVNDIERATAIAQSMVYDLGMADEIGAVRVDRQEVNGELAEKCRSAVLGILATEESRARTILSRMHDRLDAISQALVDRGRLTKPEFLELVETTKEEAVSTALTD